MNDHRTSTACRAFADRLVEHADRELLADDRAAVDRHLADCRVCRRRVAALRSSLAAAKIVWARAAEDGGVSRGAASPAATRARARRATARSWRRVAVWGMAAAGCACLIAVAGSFAARSVGRSVEIAAAAPATMSHAGERADRAALERALDDERNAARLLASAAMLAAARETRSFALASYDFVIDCYPRTAACGLALAERERLNSLEERIP